MLKYDKPIPVFYIKQRMLGTQFPVKISLVDSHGWKVFYNIILPCTS